MKGRKEFSLCYDGLAITDEVGEERGYGDFGSGDGSERNSFER